jgi:hypothetical protein
MQSESLIEREHRSVSIPKLGTIFLRNVCHAFDPRLLQRDFERPLFGDSVELVVLSRSPGMRSNVSRSSLFHLFRQLRVAHQFI